jgi:hypothetical protein
MTCITTNVDNPIGYCESRRQSNAAQRGESDNFPHNVNSNSHRESPSFPLKQKRFDKLDNTPLYINDDSQSVSECGTDDTEQIKRPLAKVKPQRILKSINSSVEDIGE